MAHNLSDTRTSTGSSEGPRLEAPIGTSVTVVRVDRRGRTPSLHQIEGHGAPKKFTLDKPEMVIGRDEKAAIAVPSANVSRRHARITCQSHEIAIHDCDSHNGVFLNGIKVHSAVLREGDIVRLADIVFEFCED